MVVVIGLIIFDVVYFVIVVGVVGVGIVAFVGFIVIARESVCVWS